jgi:hypothetical protein
VLIDSLLLARRTREVDGWRRLPLQPGIGVSQGRAWLSLGGNF